MPRRARPGAALDRFDCYERCVQNAPAMARFLHAVHGGNPRTLREDFCGTGGVCRAWVALKPPHARGRRAVGVDRDAEPLSRLRRASRPGRVRAVRADARDCRIRADVVSATNFPLGYLHTRRELLRYLRGVHASLNPGGIFVCDTYGGKTAFKVGATVRDVWCDGGLRIRYTWEQRDADPLTAMVTNVLHFRGDAGGTVVFDHPEAFVYRWRLWSVPEIREALRDAGFRRTDVYSTLADAVDQHGRAHVRPVEDPAELEPTFFVCVVGRA